MSGVVTASLLPDPPRRRHEEDSLQATVMEYLDLALPPDAVAHHSPGEGKRTKAAQAKLRRSGYKAGWPDVEIVWKGRSFFVELKAQRGTLSAAQRQMIDRLHLCGAAVVLCRSLEGVENSLREMGLPLRASATGWRPRSRAYEQTQLGPWGQP